MRNRARRQRRILFRPHAIATLAALLSTGAAPSAALAESKSLSDPGLSAQHSPLELPGEAPLQDATRVTKVSHTPPRWMGEHFHFQ